MTDDKSFDQATYWKSRHQKLAGDPRSVGNWGRSLEENYEGERELKRQIDSVLPLIGGRSALDLGCGYGRVAPEFVSHGYDYTGVDVSDVAIDEARLRAPQARFEVADLRSWNTDRRYDVVCALYVFVHFVRDEDWSSVVRRALSWVAPGGALLLADQLETATRRVAEHVVIRTLRAYLELFESYGFVLDERFADAIRGDAKDFYLARRR